MLKTEDMGFIAKNTVNHLAQNLSYHLDKPICFPTMIYFAPTLRCNLQCKYCSIWKEGNIQEEMSLEKWKEFLKDIYNWVGKGQHIGITGGEPLLREDIFEILGFIRGLEFKTSLTTNGTLLNEKIIEKLTELNLFNINISLESLNEKTHDFFRGKGNFEKTLKNILKMKQALKDNNLKTLLIVETTLTSENLNGAVDLLKFCEENNLKIHFGNVVENLQIDYQGNFEKESEYKPKNSEDIDRVFSFLISHKKNIVNSTAELKMMQNYYKDKKISFKCSATARNIFVNYNGEVKLCQYFPRVGNIKENSIRNIWHSEKANEQRKIMKNCKKICQFDCYKQKSLFEEYELYKALYH
ncbi:MAG: radical SAM protein [Candidatus Nanoarchaeia archaeon]|nr:radical SAM protein [Candidatus Nanoarchaeia archaeon]MDD5358161.1 radical SAM protein [Candidatus Nanoarchaeia archaeon]MDD5589348.1 radical SAM protein [Candidatus Nanoarchaeia archaeon]